MLRCLVRSPVALEKLQIGKVEKQTIQIKLPDFHQSRKGDDSSASELDKLRREAARKSAEQARNIQIDLLGVDPDLVDPTQSDAIQRKLAGAREHIAKRQFK